MLQQDILGLERNFYVIVCLYQILEQEVLLGRKRQQLEDEANKKVSYLASSLLKW